MTAIFTFPWWQNVSEQPGGDGKVKMDLNLKELAGDPSDEAVGAAAVGLMAQAVKAKGPDETQVNALTGFSHQIMSTDQSHTQYHSQKYVLQI